MVGYGIAIHLNAYQANWFANLEIVDGHFATSNASLSLNTHLLDALSSSMAECTCFRMSSNELGHPERSQAQLNCVWVNLLQNVLNTEAYLQCYLETRSPDRQDLTLASAGLLFFLRLERGARPVTGRGVINNWCTYLLNDYAGVPAAWIATANQLGTTDSNYLGMHMFETSAVSRMRYLQA